MKTLLHAFLRRVAVPGLWIAFGALALAGTAGAQSLVEAAKKVRAELRAKVPA